ncbi:MAG: pseudouridine synthase [Dehalococcoidales bacterium]|nr:pseudouridine synthase [Dehalococcoidales bacterium]
MQDDEVRLQKALAQAGVSSRRAAEDLIRQGRVAVNGAVVTTLGTKVRPGVDRVTVDGREVGPAQNMVYFALNKPAGYVSTTSDTHGRPTVLDLVPKRGRLYPVGRLDADTEGLLLITNDGEFAYRVTHPKHELEKEYHALVRGLPDREDIALLRRGVEIEGRLTALADVGIIAELAGETWLRVTLHEGRKRQVRLMCAAVGHPVIRLRRVRVGPVALGDLPTGKWRELSPAEVAALQHKEG